MRTSLSALLNLYIFSTGRRILAVTETKRIATAKGHTALVTHCDACVVHDREALQVEARWSSDKDAPQYAPEAKQVDILVDVAIGALRDTVEAEARDASPGEPLAGEAAALGQELFPNGLTAITQTSYPEELAQLQRLIGCLQSAKWSNTVRELGFTRRLTRLIELELRYAVLVAAPTTTVTFADVRNVRAKGQNLMLQAVAMILGLHPGESEADIAAREELLGLFFGKMKQFASIFVLAEVSKTSTPTRAKSFPRLNQIPSRPNRPPISPVDDSRFFDLSS